MNYHLKKRLLLLPNLIYKSIYSEFMSLRFGSANRWKMLLEDRATDVRAQEALIMCKHIGCTLPELLNSDIDLLQIWQERKQKPERKERSKMLGLSAA